MTESVPLTFVNFRPAGRPFPLGHRRGCRHARRNDRWGHASTSRKDDVACKTVSYDNDMMTSSIGNEMKLDRHFRGGERQIPARWTGFRHGGPGFEYKHDDGSHEMERVRPHRHHRRHHHHDEDENEELPRRAADLERRERRDLGDGVGLHAAERPRRRLQALAVDQVDLQDDSLLRCFMVSGEKS